MTSTGNIRSSRPSQRGGPGADEHAVGNRSLLFRDPDGNLINFFTPVSPEVARNTLCEVIGEMLALHTRNLSIHIRRAKGRDGVLDDVSCRSFPFTRESCQILSRRSKLTKELRLSVPHPLLDQAAPDRSNRKMFSKSQTTRWPFGGESRSVTGGTHGQMSLDPGLAGSVLAFGDEDAWRIERSSARMSWCRSRVSKPGDRSLPSVVYSMMSPNCACLPRVSLRRNPV